MKSRYPQAGGRAADPESAPTAPTAPRAVGKVPGSAAPAHTRRTFLLASAGVAWTVPTVLSVSRAHAAGVNSQPPKRPRPKGTVPQMGPALPDELPGTLAYTGVEQKREVEVAVAAIGTGAAIVALARQPKRELT